MYSEKKNIRINDTKTSPNHNNKKLDALNLRAYGTDRRFCMVTGSEISLLANPLFLLSTRDPVFGREQIMRQFPEFDSPCFAAARVIHRVAWCANFTLIQPFNAHHKAVSILAVNWPYCVVFARRKRVLILFYLLIPDAWTLRSMLGSHYSQHYSVKGLDWIVAAFLTGKMSGDCMKIT